MGRAGRETLATGQELGHGAIRFVNRLVLPTIGIGAVVAIWALTSAVDIEAAFVDLRVMALSLLGGNVFLEAVVKGLMNSGHDPLAPKPTPAAPSKAKKNNKKNNKNNPEADKPAFDKKGRRLKV